MTSRKRKIIITQLTLLIAGLIIIFFTYLNFENNTSNKILTDEVKSEIDKKINEDIKTGSIFYDIEYAGVDLSGNRYILKAKEAKNNETIEGLLNLKFVNAIFYFKDDRILKIYSDFGLYNNKTLDMTFEKNVNGNFEGSILIAEKAEYLNSKNLLIISNDVKLKDIRGTMFAEKLIFDIEENTLNISSGDNEKVNANINY